MILPFHFQVIFRFHVSFQGCTIHLGIIYFNPIPDHPCMVYLPAFGDCLTVIFPLSFYGDVPPSYDASIGSIADELPTLPTALTPRMPPRWGVSALPLHPWDWQKGCPAQHIGDELMKHPESTKPMDEMFNMGVSENRGFSPQIFHFNRVFHFLTIDFGVSLFLETPIYIQAPNA